jgi:AcrR family transcriptional regulator
MRARPGDDKRERILAAAVELLRERGVQHFSQIQVAKAAGLEQGHLTYFFPRRRDLLAAVARAHGDATHAEAVAIAGRGEGARSGGAGLIRRLAHDRARTRMWLGLLVEADGDASLRSSLVANTRVVRAALAELMGRPEDALDVAVALYALWGVAIAHLLHRGDGDDAHTDRLLARLLALVAGAEPEPRARPRRRKKRRS